MQLREPIVLADTWWPSVPHVRRDYCGLDQFMNQYTAIIDGKRCTMLTDESMEGAAASCRDRVGARFQGFETIPTKVKAQRKWVEYRHKKISRQQLEV